jgi:hypothetical protein
MDTKLLLKEVKKEIARLEKVAKLLGAKGTGKRKMSAKARKAIGDAQRARWAKADKKPKA